jgi:hypothetical protein
LNATELVAHDVRESIASELTETPLIGGEFEAFNCARWFDQNTKRVDI